MRVLGFFDSPYGNINYLGFLIGRIAEVLTLLNKTRPQDMEETLFYEA
jgi:hypothetical protein